jgi:hypothetical protein
MRALPWREGGATQRGVLSEFCDGLMKQYEFGCPPRHPCHSPHGRNPCYFGNSEQASSYEKPGRRITVEENRWDRGKLARIVAPIDCAFPKLNPIRTCRDGRKASSARL